MKTSTNIIKRTCRNCLRRFPCLKLSIRPAIGECSGETRRSRTAQLEQLKQKLLRNSPLFLKKAVTVEADFLGDTFPHSVRKVSLFPGSPLDSLVFSLGKDEYGNEVTTEQIDSTDIKNINNSIL